MTLFFLFLPLDPSVSVSVALVADHTLLPDRVLIGESLGHSSVGCVWSSSASLDSKSDTYLECLGL